MPKLSKLLQVVDEQGLLEWAKLSIYESESVGFCLSCGEQHDSVEPDAEEYECGFCGEHQVYGIENILMYL